MARPSTIIDASIKLIGKSICPPCIGPLVLAEAAGWCIKSVTRVNESVAGVFPLFVSRTNPE